MQKLTSYEGLNANGQQYLSQIDEQIEKLQELQKQFNNERQYSKAQQTMNYINQLKQQKITIDRKQIQSAHKSQFENLQKVYEQQKQELLEIWDNKMIEFSQNAEATKMKLMQKQEEEFEQAKIQIENVYQQIIEKHIKICRIKLIINFKKQRKEFGQIIKVIFNNQDLKKQKLLKINVINWKNKNYKSLKQQNKSISKMNYKKYRICMKFKFKIYQST